MMYLSRRFTFSASHRLHAPGISAEANRCAFGVCENLHGHNYRLQVTVRGEVDAHTGFFANVMELVATVNRLVVDECDHRCLNDVPLFAGVTTTMENIAQRVWATIEAPLKAQGMDLYEVQVGETEDHWATLRRD